MAPRLIGNRIDGKVVVKYAFLPMLIVGVAAELTVPFQQWSSPAEANATMLASPPAIDGQCV